MQADYPSCLSFRSPRHGLHCVLQETTSIQPTTENGLRQVSVALVFQLRAIDRRRVEERIGSVSREVLNEIFAELDKLTGRTAQHAVLPSDPRHLIPPTVAYGIKGTLPQLEAGRIFPYNTPRRP